MVDFEEAYAWLRLGDGHASRFSPYTQQLVSQMLEAIDGNQQELSWGLLERLDALRRDLPDQTEVAEVLTECGRAAYRLGNHKAAVKYLRDAIDRYLWHNHQVAVIQWMLGCVLWRIPGEHTEAIRLWEHSLEMVDVLSRGEMSSRLTVEYRARWVAMDQSLRQAIAQDGMGAGPTAHSTASPLPPGATSAQPPPASTAQHQPPQKIAWDLLELFAVTEMIPAGGFGPTGFEPHPSEHVEVEQLLISGRVHRIQSLRTGKLIKLNFSHRYTVLKVTGDSMNLENIQDGDYVLLKMQYLPDENDIVAAEVVGDDTRATLKIFTRTENKIVLRPHSTNPIHKPHEFSALNDGFYIRGIVVAVLKPV